ncbi:MAG: hypothetical protein ACKOHI_00920 [Phycisphaerales bacterium]
MVGPPLDHEEQERCRQRVRPQGAERAGATAGGGITLSDLWPYALAAALVILSLEWWVYHRRHWIRRDASAQRVRPLGAGGAPIIRA